MLDPGIFSIRVQQTSRKARHKKHGSLTPNDLSHRSDVPLACDSLFLH